MIRAGMNIARINFAHGDYDSHRRTITNVRAAAEAVGQHVTLFGDLPGPKMRIGRLAEEPIELERGQAFVLQTEKVLGNQQRVSMDFAGLSDAVQTGDSIYMNDGYIQLTVDRVQGQAVHCTVQVGGELRSNKGVNFPGIDLGISAFTAHDRELLAFAAEQELDGVGESFVQGPEDILALREAAAALDYDPFVIAKIERSGALENIEAILQVTDAIMVARGDLGVEIPIAEIPAAQKHLIRWANVVGKPVITATQMLESMTHNRRPTRAEATDVANAILDGTDGVMLSGETAIGRYPAETVDMMASLARGAEARAETMGIADLLKMQQHRGEISRENLISLAVYLTVETLQPEVVIILSRSGATARRVARFGLSQWIVAPCHIESTCRCLQLSHGVYPVYVPDPESLATLEARRQYAWELLRQHGIDHGLVLLVEGSGTLKARDTQRIDIIDLG
jgi:pyruvate kinase